MKKPSWRRLERAAAWIAVVVAWCTALLGLVGPHLGGSGPGLQGPVGFAVEIVAAMWVPGGVLTAIVAAVASLRRLWWPAAALAAIAFVILVPYLWAHSRSPTGHHPHDDPVLRIAAVNLDENNVDDPYMVESLRRIDADVLVLSELTSSWSTRLELELADDYPHRWRAAAPEHPGLWLEGLTIAVWSRIPAAGAHEVRSVGETYPQLRVPLRWRGRAFALYGIHARKPYPYGLFATTWRTRGEILDWIRGEPLTACIVAGDFNATPRSAFLARLRGLGLASASEAVCGRAPVTWPMRRDTLEPIRVAIDHVMHSDAFTAVDFRTGKLTNSDHAPVFAELVWRNE